MINKSKKPVMPKYMNAKRREGVYWAAVLYEFYKNNREYYQGDSLKWLDSILISLDQFMATEYKGVDAKELRAMKNIIKQTEPRLVMERKFTPEDNTVRVMVDEVNDFAEYALEYCMSAELMRQIKCMTRASDIKKLLAQHPNCPKCQPDSCTLRELALKMGIPGLIEQGPCQFYRGSLQNAAS